MNVATAAAHVLISWHRENFSMDYSEVPLISVGLMIAKAENTSYILSLVCLLPGVFDSFST